MMAEMQSQELRWLVEPIGHISLLANRRTAMLATRIQLVAGLIAILTPLYIPVEMFMLPYEIWSQLAVARLLATAAFIFIIYKARRADTLRKALSTLGMILVIGVVFYLYTYQFLEQFQLNELQAVFATGYTLLPFVMLAILSIFPLTILENVVFSIPLLIIQFGFVLQHWDDFGISTIVSSYWLLILISGVSVLAGMSQLAFMIVLVRESMRDGLTGCFSRNSGEELLDLQFLLSCRSATQLSVAFFDLDHFKQINDKYGHDAGDRALIEFTRSLRSQLRSSDMLARWGGEEFLLIMPGADIEQARSALERCCHVGLGRRPDGTPLTASIGISERQHDHAETWEALVDLSDKRMYLAKQAGRNRINSSG